jgi:hypothetical protein
MMRFQNGVGIKREKWRREELEGTNIISAGSGNK